MEGPAIHNNMCCFYAARIKVLLSDLSGSTLSNWLQGRTSTPALNIEQAFARSTAQHRTRHAPVILDRASAPGSCHITCTTHLFEPSLASANESPYNRARTGRQSTLRLRETCYILGRHAYAQSVLARHHAHGPLSCHSGCYREGDAVSRRRAGRCHVLPNLAMNLCKGEPAISPPHPTETCVQRRGCHVCRS